MHMGSFKTQHKLANRFWGWRHARLISAPIHPQHYAMGAKQLHPDSRLFMK